MTTTTTFIGDIKFKDGDTDRLVSDLATVDEVNEAFTKYYDKTQCDNTFALKSTTYTKTECDDKFALKGESSSGNTIDAYSKAECDSKFATTYNPRYTTIATRTFSYFSPGWDIQGSFGEHFMIKGTLNNKTFIFNDSIGSTGDSSTTIRILNQTFDVYFGVGGTISITDNNKILNISSVSIVQSTGITTDIVYTDDLVQYMSNQSTTITHYAPIEENIDNYHIGHPTFMSGKVYKQVENDWIQSTPTDTTDCICSCITTGTSKTFAGIITSIDAENNSITFATHGDYLFKVDDTTKYTVGDTICYDGSIVDVNTTLTIVLSQSIIGKVSCIVDDETLAIFKTM